MLDIAEHRRGLILENLAQLDKRIDKIQEECIILYLNSFIGGKAEQISAYQFSNITHIKCDTVLRVLKRSVSLSLCSREDGAAVSYIIGIESLMN